MRTPVRGTRQGFERCFVATAMIAMLVVLASWWSGRNAAAVAAGDAVPRPLYDKHAPVDPVKTNGEIFAGWPKPDATLLFSGEQDGYIEPCGCAGLQNQKGGLKRRHTLIKELAAKGWNVVPMDVGGLSK